MVCVFVCVGDNVLDGVAVAVRVNDGEYVCVTELVASWLYVAVPLADVAWLCVEDTLPVCVSLAEHV